MTNKSFSKKASCAAECYKTLRSEEQKYYYSGLTLCLQQHENTSKAIYNWAGILVQNSSL